MIIYTFSTTANFERIYHALTDDNENRVKLGLNCSTDSYLDLHCTMTAWHKEEKPNLQIHMEKREENKQDKRNIIKIVFFWPSDILGNSDSLQRNSEDRIKIIRKLLKKLPDFREEPQVI